MPEYLLEQANYSNGGGGGFRFLARSAGFRDDWLAEAERLCTGFGERPAGVACVGCVFARPFGKAHVAVVQVCDLGTDDAGRPGALGFRLLIVARAAYHGILAGDPFLLAERFPPAWEARGELPALPLPAEAPPDRTVADVRKVLKREDGPTLLGGAQALVDGGRLVFERPAPDTDLVRGLWTLLPTSTRSELWPASFAFGNALGFHVLVVPRAASEEYPKYLREEHAGDYPEGRYELDVQIAAEAGDQRELDALFRRRSSAQTLKLAALLVVVMSVLAVLMNAMTRTPPAKQAPKPKQPPPPAASAELDLPPPEDFPEVDGPERRQLTEALRELAGALEVPALPAEATAEELLHVVDQKLGTPSDWQFGSLDRSQPVQRQLRVVLKKHGVAGYQDQKLNTLEMVERLRKKVVRGP